MKTLRILLAAAALILCAACFTACNDPLGPNRDNPIEVTLASAAFDITILDHERGFRSDSNYVFEGEWKGDAFYFGLNKTEAMVPNITKDNAITFRITSEAAGFEGVNAASDSRCINIVQDGNDHSVYHLEWVSEGEANITFWNGTDADRKQVKFKVTSLLEIPMTGVMIRKGFSTYEFGKVDYEGVVTNMIGQHDWETITDNGGGRVPVSNIADIYKDDWSMMEPVEMFPLPLNATPKEWFFSSYAFATLKDKDTKEKVFYRQRDLLLFNREHWSGCNWLDCLANWGVDMNQDALSRGDIIKVYPSDLREKRLMLFQASYDGYANFRVYVADCLRDDFDKGKMVLFRIEANE